MAALAPWTREEAGFLAVTPRARDAAKVPGSAPAGGPIAGQAGGLLAAGPVLTWRGKAPAIPGPGAGVPEDAPGGPAFLLACRDCASTQDLAFALLAAGVLPEWGGVAAAVQSAGRGQLRRAWVSGPGNLHLSVRWPLPTGEHAAFNPLFTLVVGAALAEALGQALEPPEGAFQLKWPNDVLWNGRKVGGVLVEERGGVAVVGMGLNLASAPPESALREGHAMPAASFRDIGPAGGREPTPLALSWALVQRMQMTYRNTLRQTNPENFLKSLSRRMAWMGREAILDQGRERVRGTLVGLAPDGGLILQTGEGTKVFHTGSVTPVERA
jgi:BirA family biotin operon repressor/biotin-[acetyl-CoA-carboxylase] ligase